MSNEKPHVQQARNELANALAHGNGERAKAARKALAAAGVEEAGQARRAAAAASDEGAEEQRATPPKGRTRRPQETTQAAGPDPEQTPRRKPGDRQQLG